MTGPEARGAIGGMSVRAPPTSVFAQVPHLRAEIGRRTVRERISDKLASLIASGILQVGEELPSERELAALLSVSQGSRTRVVSRKIDTLKIGVARPSAINSYELDSVHKSRLLIERAVAAEAAVHIDDTTLARLEQSLAIQKQTMRDPVHFLICDREFHLTIYRSCGNPLLADFVTDLYTFMLDHRRTAVYQPGAIEKSYLDHVAIFEALSARDPEAATEAFGQHIDRIYATTVDILADKSKPRKTAQPRQSRMSRAAIVRAGSSGKLG